MKKVTRKYQCSKTGDPFPNTLNQYWFTAKPSWLPFQVGTRPKVKQHGTLTFYNTLEKIHRSIWGEGKQLSAICEVP